MPVLKRLDGTVICEYNERFGLSRIIGAQRLKSCLQNADLRGADLEGADLTDADMTGADLTGANLCNAKLQGAVLNDANCTEADFTDIDFQDVDVGNANFHRANFIGSFVYNVDVSSAHWDGALIDKDLRDQIEYSRSVRGGNDG